MELLLFNFPDFGLFNDELEPILSLTSLFNKDKEDKEDKWYNIPFNSNFNLNDKAPFAPPFTLLKSIIISVSASRTTTPIYKEHFINTRIKAIIILHDKVPLSRIIKVINISRNRIYILIVTIRERR
jgi:hypothetical protein